MLRRLTVENYALIDRLDIEFDRGLNIITGETGSGKSILLGALGLVLGNRAESSVLRDAERNCVVEAEFDLSQYDMKELFDSHDLEYDNQSVIRRIITSAGKSRSYVNDVPVQQSALREIGERLIDIHSQHQTLLLGDSRFQTDVLDNVASNSALLAKYTNVYHKLTASKRELSRLISESDESSREREYISFQYQQLSEAKLVDGEQQEAEERLNELTNASQIKETMLYASSVLDGGDDNILTQLKSIEGSVGRLQSVYRRAEEFYTRIHSVLLDLRDISAEISLEADRVEANDALMESTSQRLDMIYSLQQKHKVSSISELLGLQADYERKLAEMDNSSTRIGELKAEIEQLYTEAVSLAGEITASRRKASVKVVDHVLSILAELGMPNSQLEVSIERSSELTLLGSDTVKFMFTANKNGQLQPIEKVASGGEMSRLMLSLKSLIANHTQLPTVIFDEIDSGISGSIADRMGEIITRMSSDMQVVNITHLPQVASKGRTHFLVSKNDTKTGTQTSIVKLDVDARVAHIASMLSGANVTDAALEQARLLLSTSSPEQ